MKSTSVVFNPWVNLKTGSKKLMDNGLTTLIWLLVLATVVYATYQIFLVRVIGNDFQQLSAALKTFEQDPKQTVLIKDAGINFIKSSGTALFWSGLVILLMSVVYNIANMRVYLNSIIGKDTNLMNSIKFGLSRFGVASLFALYVFGLVVAYILLSSALVALLPPTILLVIPLTIVMFFLLLIRLFYSMQIVADSNKPKVLTILNYGKELYKASSSALVVYILLCFAIIIITSSILSGLLSAVGSGPSNNYGFVSQNSDVVYGTFNFFVSSVIGFFLTAGWVEIYNQAKGATKQSQTSKKSSGRRKKVNN